MAWNAYDQYRLQREDAGNAAIAGTLKMALVLATYTPDQNLHDFFADITNEVTGTGYTAGGNALTGYAVTISAAGLITVDSNDPIAWAQDAAGFTAARRAIIYWDTAVAATSRLLAYSDDFGADKGNVAGPFSVTMDALGIFTQAR